MPAPKNICRNCAHWSPGEKHSYIWLGMCRMVEKLATAVCLPSWVDAKKTESEYGLNCRAFERKKK